MICAETHKKDMQGKDSWGNQCPGLPETVPVYTSIPVKIINNAPCHYKTCPGLINILYDHPCL